MLGEDQPPSGEIFTPRIRVAVAIPRLSDVQEFESLQPLLREKLWHAGIRQRWIFVLLNHQLIVSEVPASHEQALAIDASFIDKSGKKSYGLGSFWNGCHSRSERGQEISVVAWVDISANTAYTLSVEQTPGEEGESKAKAKAKAKVKTKIKTKGDKSPSRTAYYLDQLRRVSAQVKSASLKYLLTDGGVQQQGLYRWRCRDWIASNRQAAPRFGAALSLRRSTSARARTSEAL